MVFNIGNPRYYWNYADESFVGEVARLAKTDGGPARAVAAAERILSRYRVLK